MATTDTRHQADLTPRMKIDRAEQDAANTQATLWTVLAVIVVAALGYLAYAAYYNTNAASDNQVTLRDNANMGSTGSTVGTTTDTTENTDSSDTTTTTGSY